VKPGRALEIWTLWDRAVGPRSIGLIDRARTVTLNVKNLPPTGVNQLFEITDEPATGSPIGRPTGDILYKGTTTRAL
jgi:anti-sigma-K factor RskA